MRKSEAKQAAQSLKGPAGTQTQERHSFWDVKWHEKQHDDALRQEVDSLRSQVDVAARSEALHHQPGFDEFQKALVRLRENRIRELVTGTFDDPGLREARARVQALDDVIALTSAPQIRGVLETRLKERENDLEATLRRRPKPKSKDPS